MNLCYRLHTTQYYLCMLCGTVICNLVLMMIMMMMRQHECIYFFFNEMSSSSPHHNYQHQFPVSSHACRPAFLHTHFHFLSVSVSSSLCVSASVCLFICVLFSYIYLFVCVCVCHFLLVIQYFCTVCLQFSLLHSYPHLHVDKKYNDNKPSNTLIE